MSELITTIKVSKKTKMMLWDKKRADETYNDYLVRVLA